MPHTPIRHNGVDGIIISPLRIRVHGAPSNYRTVTSDWTMRRRAPPVWRAGGKAGAGSEVCGSEEEWQRKEHSTQPQSTTCHVGGISLSQSDYQRRSTASHVFREMDFIKSCAADHVTLRNKCIWLTLNAHGSRELLVPPIRRTLPAPDAWRSLVLCVTMTLPKALA